MARGVLPRRRELGERRRQRSHRAWDHARPARLDPLRHPARVDDRRSRQLLRRDGRRADLPHQFTRGMRIRAAPFRGAGGLLRGRNTGREDRPDQGPVPGPQARDRLLRRDPGDAQHGRSSRTSEHDIPDEELHAPDRGGQPARHGEPRLHLGHDRTPEGLHAHPPQLHRPEPRARGAPPAAAPRSTDRLLPVPAVGARVRSHRAGVRVRRRGHAHLLAA